MIHCNKCNLSKPASEFHKEKRNRTGYSTVCKPCHKKHYESKSQAKKRALRKVYTKKCDHCSSDFTTTRKNQKYCQSACAKESKTIISRKRSREKSKERGTLEQLELKEKGLFKCKHCDGIFRRGVEQSRHQLICKPCRATNRRKKPDSYTLANIESYKKNKLKKRSPLL